MLENIDISVIVPVYNVEKFLRRCVESILSQDFKNFEIILVDDGSPDNCGRICDEFASKDNRVRAIHQENQGVSVARNTGIDAAKGRYICFVDSDDTLPIDALSNMWQLVKRYPDVDVVCGQLSHANHILCTSPTVPEYTEDRKLIRSLYLWRILNYFGVSRLISRDFICKYRIYFEPGIRCGEDPLWVYFIHKHVRSVAQCRKIVYIYSDDNNESVMHQKDRTPFYCSTLETAIIACRNFGPDGRNAENAYLLDLFSADRLTRALEYGSKEKIEKKVEETYKVFRQFNKEKRFKFSAQIAVWRLTKHNNRFLWNAAGLLYWCLRILDKVDEKFGCER